VYSIEVKIESMFDNVKGRMIQRTDIFFSSCGYAGEFGGRESSFLRVDRLAISATSRELLYGMSFENEHVDVNATALVPPVP